MHSSNQVVKQKKVISCTTELTHPLTQHNRTSAQRIFNHKTSVTGH